ncbi:hypothetical protein SEA_SCHMIDT_68 [Gordonia phage Schmidt]|uniref:Ribbon-helix-helix DNA binding domain protein n=1 Tax=Gordonia phage Schmidt TaxID=2301697 RepID=A0A385E2N0_9CAUD|nr:hypothetical protein KDJ59_gp68 [Gordonia phage Schmidt]AXQ65187.1 hypothetical protein SEA_SCHMIDT_68 [Gordonia phage Schmidt]
MASSKPQLRSIVVELPEPELMKLVKLAASEGTTTRAIASQKLLDAAKGIE